MKCLQKRNDTLLHGIHNSFDSGKVLIETSSEGQLLKVNRLLENKIFLRLYFVK